MLGEIIKGILAVFVFIVGFGFIWWGTSFDNPTFGGIVILFGVGALLGAIKIYRS